jgi:two-component system chemotaxis response regulator CheB
VRVLIAEDSATSRALLVSLCEADPDLKVVGQATNGLEALELAKQLCPSVVVMDIHMPVMDGFEATKRIMIEAPTPIVIVTAALDPRAVEVSLRAVQVGALTVLPKPNGPYQAGDDQTARRLVSTLKALSEVTVIRRRWSADDSVAPSRHRVAPGLQPPGVVKAVAVAASTGGPAALYRLFERLPRDADVPILVVQHIAEGFAPGLTKWLGSGTPLPVKLAQDGEALVEGTVYVAPDGTHLQAGPAGTVKLSDGPPIGGFRPSATALFCSMAEVYAKSAVGVVLTGMGRDGFDGMQALKAAGGRILAQDERTSVVYGMPGVVAAAGIADVVAPVDDLAAELTTLVSRRFR